MWPVATFPLAFQGETVVRKAEPAVTVEGSLTLNCISVVAAVTVTFAVAVIEAANISVAFMLWLPAVIKVTPLVKVWEPASAAVNK